MTNNLLYSLCYYYGKNKLSNINRHLECFKRLPQTNKTFIVTLMINSKNNDERIQISNEIGQYIESLYVINYKVLHSYNWGGTILGLYLVYQYYKDFDENTYVCHFEEDFYPINNKWLDHVKKYLNDKTKNYIYIGETTKRNGIRNPLGRLNREHDDGRGKGRAFKKYRMQLKTPEVWSNGGFYGTTIKNLNLIENKLGIFHKGNKETQWSLNRDGIDIGEVGFPTLLHHSGFNFTALHRKKFFKHDDCRYKD